MVQKRRLRLLLLLRELPQLPQRLRKLAHRYSHGTQQHGPPPQPPLASKRCQTFSVEHRAVLRHLRLQLLQLLLVPCGGISGTTPALLHRLPLPAQQPLAYKGDKPLIHSTAVEWDPEPRASIQGTK